MTTLLEVKNEVYEHLGRDDSIVEPMITRGVNAGLITAAILFEPSEARTNGSVVALAAANNVSITTLTRYLRIEHLYNTTGSCPMWPLGYHQLISFPLPTTGNVEYYALYGDVVHYRPVPSVNQTVSVNYLQYPARVVNDTDVLPYPLYEDFVISMTTAFAWAGLEEDESEQLWERISSIMNIPFSALSQVRTILRKEMPRVDVLQKSMAKSSA